MKLRVRERGDEVQIDIDGVSGRQHHVLQALTECRRLGSCGGSPSPLADVRVRAGADRMCIRMKGGQGLRFEAAVIYRLLRDALVGGGTAAGVGRPAP